jgi:hypothetical protein
LGSCPIHRNLQLTGIWRDRALEAFQTSYHPGSTGSVSATALEQGDDELDEDEEGQDPGREDADGVVDED